MAWYVYTTEGTIDAPLDKDAGIVLDRSEHRYAEPTRPALDRLDEAGVIDVVDYTATPDELEGDSPHETDAPPALSGTPEPVVDDDGDVVLVDPADGPPEGTGSIDVGTWVCQRCGARTYTPGVVDGELIKPQTCESCERQGPFRHLGAERLDANILLYADPPWHPPSGIEQSPFDSLWDDIEAFIRDYWYHPTEEFYPGLTGWVLSSWVRDNLDFLGHVVALGSFETGKSRLFNTLERVSYRATSPVSTTPAAMYRLVDDLNVTFLISEYHDLDQDYRQEVNAVAKGSQKRGEEVFRTKMGSETGTVRKFDTFTHVGLGTQHDLPDDLKSRSIVIQTRKAESDMPDRFNERRAERLRNRLLYWRFRLHHSPRWYLAEERAAEILDNNDVSDRTREILLPIVTAGVVAGRVDRLGGFLFEIIASQETTRHESEDAAVVQAITNATFETLRDRDPVSFPVDDDGTPLVQVRYEKIVDNYQQMVGEDLEYWRLGTLRKRLGFEAGRYAFGTVLEDPDLIDRLQELCDRYGIEWAPPRDVDDFTTTDTDDTADDDERDADDSTAGLKQQVIEAIAAYDTPADPGMISRKSGLDVDTVTGVVETLKSSGRVYSPPTAPEDVVDLTSE